jgi:hypothetical protein
MSRILAAVLVLLLLVRERQGLLATFGLIDWRQWGALVLLVATLVVSAKYAWSCKMRRRLRIAKHLLYCVELGLAGYGVWRFGFPGLFDAVRKVDRLEWLILVLTVLTVMAFYWEFRGRKLTTSHQEVRFVQGIRQLLVELQNFCFKSDPLDSSALDTFLVAFLGVARDVLCGEKNVGADLMVQSGEWLNTVKRSGYPIDAEDVPVKLSSDGEHHGAAGLAFDKMQLVYLPDKEWEEAWVLIRGNHEEYRALAPQTAWTYAKDARKERFHSILCVPVAGHGTEKKRAKLGVLNFTTVTRDPFVNRDFAMAECFGAILSHALTFREIAEDQGRRAS